jgi:Putative esterase
LVGLSHGMADPVVCGERITLHSRHWAKIERSSYRCRYHIREVTRDTRSSILRMLNGRSTRVALRLLFLQRNGLIPEIIVVGVAHSDRTRDLYATKANFKQSGRTIPFPSSGKTDQFLEFLEKEVIPWVESTYRAAPPRILAGHSAGGNFALHAMRMRPGLVRPKEARREIGREFP